MSYVDAGYIAALGTLFLYAIGLVLQRRRLERALKVSGPGADATPGADPADDAVAPGGRP